MLLQSDRRRSLRRHGILYDWFIVFASYQVRARVLFFFDFSKFSGEKFSETLKMEMKEKWIEKAYLRAPSSYREQQQQHLVQQLQLVRHLM